MSYYEYLEDKKKKNEEDRWWKVEERLKTVGRDIQCTRIHEIFSLNWNNHIRGVWKCLPPWQVTKINYCDLGHI
jgi:hypothetical protein